jgi:hypothetical protein
VSSFLKSWTQHLAAVKPGSNYLARSPGTEIKKPCMRHKKFEEPSSLDSIGNLLVTTLLPDG